MAKAPPKKKLDEASKGFQQRIRRRALTIADALDGIEVTNPKNGNPPDIESLARMIRANAGLTLLGIAATMTDDKDATRLIDAARRVRTK